MGCNATVSNGSAIGSTMQHEEKGMQCRCSARYMDQQQHGCRGSCCTDASVAVAGPWEIVQDATVQRMLGREA